ncbi:MAG: Major facilitator superfamily [Microgenomates group bacterium GW2011_GWC1_38_14]|nr:MAG: Major facilitator superfamily [Microgenomates group bacterium GW2011_GWC1_38_14]
MRNPILQTLRIRSFFFLLVSEFFSQIAMNLLNFILILVVFSISKSNLAVSGVVLAFTLPAVFFGLIAGVFVDRWNKKYVLILTNLLRGLAVVPLILITDDLFVIYSATFAVALVTQFFIPAETPIIPHLVKRELLMSANALFGIGIFGSIIIAYALSGPILLFLGIEKALVLLSALFIVSGLSCLLIKMDIKESQARQQSSIVREVLNTLTQIFRSKKISHSLLVLTLVQTLILIIAVIGPGYAEHVLRIKVEKFPIIFVTPAVLGMALGALIVGNFLINFSREKMRKIGLFAIGLIFVIFPHGPLIATKRIPEFLGIGMLEILITLAFILGFFLALVFVPSNTVLQEETSDEERGKIYGSLNTLVGVISFLPVVAAGSLADIFGITKVLTAIGVFLIGIVLFRFVF